MFRFCEKTLLLLRAAEWSEDRHSSIADNYVRLLGKEGFIVSKNIKEFLYKFGGLSIRHPHAKCKDITDYFHFDVIKALSSGDTSWVLEVYSSRIGKNLCIIGEAFRRSMVLCMAPNKEVYAGIDEKLFYIGDSGESAIESLCNGHELKVIPEYFSELEAARVVYAKYHSYQLYKPYPDGRIQENYSQIPYFLYQSVLTNNQQTISAY
ncbi:MAG: hypothetical protein B6245_10500 [Desulfobacteraceae bacterium 4572_88]|nr:MAG: hypothetical protein B6245_10500 [Desulfobacteraceae bacterium 4572_88]